MKKNRDQSKKTSASHSKSPNNRSKSGSSQVLDDDQIDELFKNITLKKPRNPFSQFVMQEASKVKAKTGKFSLKEDMAPITAKWEKLSDSEKKKFEKLYEDEKIKYQKDLGLVRHYLFKDYNDTVLRKPTAYRIFLNQRMREGLENGQTPKEVQTKASYDWKTMEKKDKEVYLERKKETDNWFAKAQKNKKVSSLSLFVTKKFEEARNNHKPPPALADIAPAWRKLSEQEKQQYEQYADELNEERRHLQDLFEITHGIKPRKPAGAYRAFLQEKAKDGVLTNIQDGKKLWDKLSEEEKEVYLAKAKRTQLAYRYKKMIFEKKIKKIYPRKPGGAFCFFLKEKKGQVPTNGETFLEYWKKEWDNLDKAKKKHYETKALVALEKYEKKKKAFDNKVFELPARPMSGYMIYVTQSIKKVKDQEEADGVDKKKRANVNDLLRKFGKEWKSMKDSEKAKYEQLASKGRKIYKREMKEFNKNGFYTKNAAKKEVDEEEEEEEEKKSAKGSKKSSRRKSRDKDEDDEDDEGEEKKKSQRKKRAPSAAKSTKKEKKGRSQSKSQKSKSRRKSQSRSKSKKGNK